MRPLGEQEVVKLLEVEMMDHVDNRLLIDQSNLQMVL